MMLRTVAAFWAECDGDTPATIPRGWRDAARAGFYSGFHRAVLELAAVLGRRELSEADIQAQIVRWFDEINAEEERTAATVSAARRLDR